MRKLFFCAALLIAVNCYLPLESIGEPQAKGEKKKDKGAPKEKAAPVETATAQDYLGLKTVTELEGKLTLLDLTQNKITINVDYQKVEPNTAAANPNKLTQQQQNQLRQQQQLAREYEQILNIRNVAQRQQRMQQFNLKVQNLALKGQVANNFNPTSMYKVVTATKEVELDLLPDFRTTRLTLVEDYDDKGNIKKYTEDELKKMRDSVLPGYTAKSDELIVGQKVKLYLTNKRPAAPAKKDQDKDGASITSDAKSAKGDDDTKAKSTTGATTTLASDRPFVRGVLIEVDVDLSKLPKSQPGKGKKKNK